MNPSRTTACRSSSKSRRKRPSSKGKKGRRGKNGKRKQTKKAVEGPSLDDVPLESYGIIQDKDGKHTEFPMAIHGLIRELCDLRIYLQELWTEVVYDGLNGVVAAIISNLAIPMIKRTESAIFVDFPGHDSFETAIKTITNGDLDKSQVMFSARKPCRGRTGTWNLYR